MDQKELQRLVDIEAIKHLKYTYAGFCDDDHNPDEVAKLFVEDGVWTDPTGTWGTGTGREGIRKLFQCFAEAIDFSQHNMFNPRIQVNGDKATGTWYLLGPYRFRKTKKEMWLAGAYLEDYVKVNGEWKYQTMRFTPRMWAGHREGWTRSLLQSEE